MPCSATSVADHGRLGPALAAVRAVVAAEVAEVDGLVDVGVPAAAAVLGVRGVLELGQRERVVLDAEVGRRRPRARPRSATSGSSALSTSAPAAARDHRGPAVGDRLELAVAVELVAEEVAEQQRARLELLDHRAEPELVDLEQPEVAGPARGRRARGGGQQRRRDAARHVRAGAVVHEARAGALEDRRRPSRRSSSCRWWRRSPRCRAPGGRRARPIACGSTRVRTLPGSDVPPPRPAGARRAPTALAAATSGGQRGHARRPAPAARRAARAPWRAARPIGSPSA